jgi:four helix bundle protein
MKYKLEGRVFCFSVSTLKTLRKVRRHELNRNILSQLTRSCTSVGANYQEANGASSRKDFRNKIHLCKKEVQESRYWIHLLAETNENLKSELRELWSEANQLAKIFGSIAGSLNNKN